MKLALKYEKSIFFIVKISIIAIIGLIFFAGLALQITELKTINRTSIVSYAIFFFSIFNLIKIFGGLKIGQTRTEEITNSVILGTIIADFITFIATFFMGISSSQYFKFYNNLTGQEASIMNNIDRSFFSVFLKHYFTNRILPSLFFMIFIILLQSIFVHISTRLANRFYFKLKPPKNTIIVFEKTSDLISLISKIHKNSNMWRLTQFVKHDNSKVLYLIENADAVFFTNIPKQARAELLKFCYKLNKTIYIYPDVHDILFHNSTKMMADDAMLFKFNNFNMSFEQAFFKRSIDILFSLIILIFVSPIMLIIAILIKIYDRGPVLFKQKRLTKHEKEFNLLKFRSMRLNAEKETGVTLAAENDVRITPVGRFLRRFRLDELPQLLNILKGDLSLVGPRPERKEYITEFEKRLPEFKYRLKVKAGLTGLAQINGKYNTKPKDKLALDLCYIEKYSIWLDLKIILKTLIVFLKPESTEGKKPINQSLIDYAKSKIVK